MLSADPIFVRHGRALTQRDQTPGEWPLDPEYSADVDALTALLPRGRVVVSSDMRRAAETAEAFGIPVIDSRLREVARPWSDDLEGNVARYLGRAKVEDWEPQGDAVARVQDVVNDHPGAIFVTHGTVMTLYLAAVIPTLNALEFWTQLKAPDAWLLRGATLHHLRS